MSRFVRQPVVTVFTRRGCGLCVAVERAVAAEAGRATVTLVDIDNDPELTRRYHVRVPVVLVDGVEVAEVQVVPGVVRRALRRARWRRFLGDLGRDETPAGQD